MNGRPRIVCRRPDGFWSQKRLDADRAASVHPAQREAQQTARTQLRSGGGELIAASDGGQFRAKDNSSRK
ncbi:MAG TPA: DUF2188 domain-containing protein [Longimicrobium sp.]|jgi:hypothetical protein